ncbi:hypothetical protein [[Hallella] seregens]|uniref:hypothetical protein n=1 Tax=Hallella seregens TaxID=52229 RepID=UPI0012ECAB28|nr:hypothetical protein [Hallella seregens]
MAFGVHRSQGLGTPFFLCFIVSHSWERHFFFILSFPTLGNAIFSSFYRFPLLGTPFFHRFIVSHPWERHFFIGSSFPKPGKWGLVVEWNEGIAVGAGTEAGPYIWNNKQAFLAKTDGFHPFALHVPFFFVTL